MAVLQSVITYGDVPSDYCPGAYPYAIPESRVREGLEVRHSRVLTLSPKVTPWWILQFLPIRAGPMTIYPPMWDKQAGARCVRRGSMSMPLEGYDDALEGGVADTPSNREWRRCRA